MSRLFGTDGIRGIANTELNCELAMEVARATAIVMEEDIDQPASFIVGSDTRISAGMLEAAINAGLCSVGANAINIGVVPTPALSYLVSNVHADAGIMISASHNPFEFNGIKIFGADGNKLTDEQEFLIENIISSQTKPYSAFWREDIGTISKSRNMLKHYIDHIIETIKGMDLSHFKVALDCSNGSASVTARILFERLGIDTTVINDQPNGININNKCGSTHMENLAELVKNGEFDAGFAFDGDADRCLMVDENGKMISGDEILAILALDLKNQNKLNKNTLVATVMSNMGIFQFAKENEIDLDITKVGDRYVLESMLENGFNLGGEQSGHVILKDYMCTGDGQLTAIHILGALKRSGKKMSELAKIMTVYPQVLENINADAKMKSALTADIGAQKIIDKAAVTLGEEGRIFVRASGTEPLIRVMIEGKDSKEIEQLAKQVSEDLHDRLKYND